MTKKGVFFSGIMSMLLSSGCSLGIGESGADGKLNVDTAGFYNLMIATVSSTEQQRLFGPFPYWKIQEGSYRYKLFTMHYLINNDTGVRDVQKSWIAALYCDVESPDKYMLKFSVRMRNSEDSMWQEYDGGALSFYVNDSNVQSIEQIGNLRAQSMIKIKICKDAEGRRYFQISISNNDYHDELRSFISAK